VCPEHPFIALAALVAAVAAVLLDRARLGRRLTATAS
jgi:hypothetical protein